MNTLPKIIAENSTIQGDCIVWNGRIAQRTNYGKVWLNGKSRSVHRVSYEHRYGKIPDGLVIDHLCRNRICVNPDHLEAVTSKINIMRSPIAPASINARKTHCPKNHFYTPENTYYYPDNRRACRTCRLLNRKKNYATTSN